MEVKIKSLVDLLEKQEYLHNELIASANLMNSYIKEKNMNGIQEITSRYDHLTNQIEDLENKRLILCDEIALEKQSKNSHLNIKQVIELLNDEKDKSILEKRRASLKSKINDFSFLNSKNNILIQDRISDIDSNVKMIADQVNKAAAYGKKGQMSEGKVNRHILNRIA